jgi:hypothetical protein
MKVPEDYYRDIDQQIEREPVWFGLRPLDHQQLVKDQRSVLTRVQIRPPQDDPDIMAGRFLWEAFVPRDEWSGQYILTPWDQSMPYQRDEALLSCFQELPLRSTVKLNIRSDRGLKVIQPTLIFLGEGKADAFEIRISVDGEPYFQGQLIGQQGMVRLPPLEEGQRSFHVEAPQGKTFLMNQIASDKPEHLLRFGCLLSTEGLAVPYKKRSTEDEILSMTLFAPFGEMGRSTVRVRLMGKIPDQVGPLENLTVLDRRYVVRPSGKGPFPVVNDSEQRVDLGQPFFFSMHADLPQGDYLVRIELEQGKGGFLTLSRVNPGQFEERQFRQEVILDEIADVR